MTDLDIRLAEAMGLPIFTLANYTFVDGRHDWSPSTNWAQGGPLIEQYGLHLRYPNPLVNAMEDICSSLTAQK